MRRVLLKFLLIAVFLNAAIGMPLHAGVHLLDGSVELASHGHDDDSDERSHAPCAWCSAHAETASAPPPVLDAPPAAEADLSPARRATDVPAAFRAALWSSAPRGPPSA